MPEPKKMCQDCVNFTGAVAYPSKSRCNLTGFAQKQTDGCKLFDYPVPYDEFEVGDLVEYWWVHGKAKGLVLNKDKDGHLSLGEERGTRFRGLNIPNGVWKQRVIRIIKRQAIDGKAWKHYGV